jgi:hypothetical protein
LAPPGFTIETWVYPTSEIASQSFIFGQSFGRQLVLQTADGGFCSVAFYVTDQDGNFVGLATGQQIPVGAWTHLAATWDGSNVRLYIDGEPDAQGTPSLSAIGDSGCPFSIGASGSCAPDQYFPGLIDEVSLYDRALFAGEIKAIYHAGAAGKCASIPTCVLCPPSTISCWAAEQDGSDSVGTNTAVPQNGVGFVSGVVGQAFFLDGTNQCVLIPYSPSMVTTSFSFET